MYNNTKLISFSGRQRARQAKMTSISELLEIPQVVSPGSSSGLSSHPGAAVQVPAPVDQQMQRTYGDGANAVGVKGLR